MKFPIKYKHYEIIDFLALDKVGDRSDYLVRIRNSQNGREFSYIGGISDTYTAVNKVADDIETRYDTLEHAIEVELDKGVEKLDHKLPIVSTNQELGSFYTDQSIANFMIDIVSIWKRDEDDKEKRWLQHKKGKVIAPHYPSVIDPAVGEGVFLKTSLNRDFTKTSHMFGLDLDAKAVKKWQKIHLLQAFGGNVEELSSHFFHQNGLDRIHWEQHKDKYKKQFKDKDIKSQQFDLVIGNPPFGGSGIDMKTAPESLLESLRTYELLPKEVTQNLVAVEQSQISLLEPESNKVVKTHEEVSKRLSSFPIERLFLEKFIKLAKPGGWVAIILPEGIFANSNAHNVREFITRQAKIEAIVSLPRDAFKNVGTNAKTSILFLQKYGRRTEIKYDYPIFLTGVSKTTPENFNFITKQYQKYYGGTMSDKIQITDDEAGVEQTVVRSDKLLADLMIEKPQSRWDVDYWHPKYDEFFRKLRSSDFELKALGELLIDGVDGITYGQVGKRAYSDTGNVGYLQVSNVQIDGLVTDKIKFLETNSHNDPSRSRLKQNDVLLINGGVGSLGRSCVFTLNEKYNISQDIDRLRLKDDATAEYISTFLNSKIGQIQIYRFTKGVSGQIKIGFDHVKSILIPQIDKAKILKIKQTYGECLGNKSKMQQLISDFEKDLGF